MNNERNNIINNIRKSLGRAGPICSEEAKELNARVNKPVRNLLPSRTELPKNELINLFQKMAEDVFATVERVKNTDEIPDSLTDYLKKENLPAQVVMSPDPYLDNTPWEKQTLLEIRKGIPNEQDMVSVTSAAGAVAETGTLAMFSGPSHPSTLNFLPETHVVVLPVDRITKNYEDIWDIIRQRSTVEDKLIRMPRTVNFITGPSRSGDIEQTLLLGAHGPRRLHLILVESE